MSEWEQKKRQQQQSSETKSDAEADQQNEQLMEDENGFEPQWEEEGDTDTESVASTESSESIQSTTDDAIANGNTDNDSDDIDLSVLRQLYNCKMEAEMPATYKSMETLKIHCNDYNNMLKKYLQSVVMKKRVNETTTQSARKKRQKRNRENVFPDTSSQLSIDSLISQLLLASGRGNWSDETTEQVWQLVRSIVDEGRKLQTKPTAMPMKLPKWCTVKSIRDETSIP